MYPCEPILMPHCSLQVFVIPCKLTYFFFSLQPNWSHRVKKSHDFALCTDFLLDGWEQCSFQLFTPEKKPEVYPKTY